MKEAHKSSYPKLVFRETFTDSASVRKNGGNPTTVTFSNGVGSFITGRVLYDLNLDGVYSIRIKAKTAEFVNQVLIDFRGSDNNGAGFIQLNATTGIITRPTGTNYVNGVTATGVRLNQMDDIVITGMTVKQGTGSIKTCLGAYFTGSTLWYKGDIDLVEIYSGTLTASEVANLYNDRWNTEVSGLGGQAGSNLLPNLNFTSGWTFLNLLSRTQTTFTTTGTGGAILSNVFTIGKQYNITVEGTISAGQLNLRNANSDMNPISNDFGSYIFTAVNTNLYLRNTIAATTTITKFSIQELQPNLLLDFNSTNGVLEDKTVGQVLSNVINNDYNFTTGWNIVGATNVINFNTFETTTGNGGAQRSTGVLTANKQYVINVVGTTTASFSIRNSSATANYSGDFTGNFNTVFKVTPVDNTFYVRNAGAGTTTITQLIVQEIKPDLAPTAVSIVKRGTKYSASFNGTTSRINTGSDFIGTKAVTVCGWINAYSIGEIAGRIIDNNNFIIFMGADNQLRLSSIASASTSVKSAIDSIYYNKYYFFCGVRTISGSGSIFIGDLTTAPALSGTANQASGTPATGTTNIIIGNDSGATRTFDGLIPMLQVYEGILDLATITQIWSESRKEIM